jgi:hypothetical protein
MAQVNKLGTRHTTVVRKPSGEIRVTYHSTDVVTLDANGNITLDTGGWRTNTTKTRMNQAANQFGLGFRVHQDDFSWYVTTYNPNGDKANCFAFDGQTVTFNSRTGRKVTA